MTTIEQNIMNVQGPAVICHQVNCQKVMGGGLALQIRNEWEHVYDAYMAKDSWLVGDCQIVMINSVEPLQYVANLAGQDEFGRDKVYTDYMALALALRQASDFAKANNLVLYIPYMMGCGLAGGDWEQVTEVIENIAPDAVICKLPEPS